MNAPSKAPPHVSADVPERPFGQPALVNRAPACLGPSGFDRAQGLGDIAEYHFIDLFRVIRRAGRSDAAKAQAAALYLAHEIGKATGIASSNDSEGMGRG